MDEKKLKALAAELAKDLKTEADLNQFSRMLTKLTVETALNAELTDHPGHEKNAPKTAQTPAMATRQKRCYAMTVRLN
ncbi:TPA: transposase [Salmonella enterica]|nr:transposase [Salmonella enterica]